MDPRLKDSQKKRDALWTFFPRKVSPGITAVLVRTPLTPNQITVLWGFLSVANTYLVYLAMLGHWWLVPAVFVVFVLASTLDCCDGEVARYKNLSNPVGGKLLDGICHRATEYALICAYALGGFQLTGGPAAVAVAVVLLSGEAMYTFAYERRLSTLRLHLGFKGQLHGSREDFYLRGQRWKDLTGRQRVASLTGLIHYRSLYAMIGLAWISGSALLAGLAVLAAWKHVSWLRIVLRTMHAIREAQASEAPEGSAAASSTL